MKCINPYSANVEKWWAPNNASKQQMGFNSAFKGLMAINLQKPQHLFQSKAYIISNIGFHLITIILIYSNYQIIPREAKVFCFLHKQRTYPHHKIIRSFCFQCYVQANYNLW
jgi:hypothetical protein